MRIISLCPSLTETLVHLGVGADLVGATRYCVRPREALRNVTRVGGTKDPDLTLIRQLAPDVIFVNAEENRRADIEALAREFHVDVSMPRRVADVAPHVRQMGEITGRPQAAEDLAAEIGSAVSALDPDRTEPRFSYAYFVWKDPWMVVSGDTYVSDLLRFAGGRNVFEGAADRYPTVTPEIVLSVKPDVLFFSSEPFPFRERHRAEILDTFGTSSRVSFISGDDCCWHGARTLDGLALMRGLTFR